MTPTSKNPFHRSRRTENPLKDTFRHREGEEDAEHLEPRKDGATATGRGGRSILATRIKEEECEAVYPSTIREERNFSRDV